MIAGDKGASAACYGLDTNEFYMQDGAREWPDYSMLRRICGGCEILEECREWAIKHEAFGFWGGLTPKERRRERHTRGIVVDDPLYWSGYEKRGNL